MQMEENGNASKRTCLIYGGDPSLLIAPNENHRNEKDDSFEEKANSFRHSSRIFRVSRASGSKDRHSKVFTSKGLRDRRVRLSVSTAIQFYDLQDRLGYDQPSKAVEWLIEAAAAAIDELPSLGSSFTELPSPSGEQNQPHPSKSSGCSSTSETSKSSVLSLSRSEMERSARELFVKEKDGEHFHPHCSFTKLLTDQSVAVSDADPVSAGGQVQVLPPSTDGKADYFGQGGFFARMPSQTHYLSSSPMVETAGNGEQLEMQQISFMQDHMDYNLNFAIASGLAGFERGTLQSNSSVHLTQQQLYHQLLRFSSPFSSSSSSSSMVGPNLQFVAPALAASSAENFFCSGLDGRLQLSREPPTPFLLDGYRPFDLKGKGKN